MVKNKRNYRREILEILEKHDGVRGFNKLREIGNFHRTSLQKNLKELEEAGEIVIRNYHSNRTIYSLPTFAFGSILEILFPKIFQFTLDYLEHLLSIKIYINLFRSNGYFFLFCIVLLILCLLRIFSSVFRSISNSGFISRAFFMLIFPQLVQLKYIPNLPSFSSK